MKSKRNQLFKIISMLCLAILSAGPIQAQQRRASMGSQSVAMLSSSPAGIMVVNYLKAVNAKAGDEKQAIDQLISKTLLEKDGQEKLIKTLFTDVRSKNGKLTAYMVERKSRTEFDVFVQDSHSKWIKLSLVNDQEDNYKLKDFKAEVLSEKPEGVDKPMKIQ